MANASTIALVGSESLLGREIRDIAASSDSPLELRLIAADQEEPGTLTSVGDEAAMLSNLDEESIEEARAVILAGSAESSRKALDLAGESPHFAIVDLTFAAEERPDARLRAPAVETERDEEELPAVHVIAHPAAIALAIFLRRLQATEPVRRSVIQIFAPASEQGKRGIEELQQQTVNLLSFKNLPQAVFDTQIGFAMLARYGAEAPVSLEESELRIERHLATLLAMPGEGEGAPMPSLRLIQAPVFHGYSFSAWVEFENNPGVETLENALAFGSIEVRGGDFEPPNNVGQAGQGGIAVGAIAPDRNEAEACWFWVVADNLRLAAENAVAVARELV
jgi:aspartate-semialdehyde dehydrogenase